MIKSNFSERNLEPQIKATILNYLRDKYGLKTYGSIINEFTIGNFSRRVDLAVIKENSLLAFEVKSEADSLSRLQGQTQKYLKYFDKVTIVAATKHIPKVFSLVPSNVAIWEFVNHSIIIRQRGRKIKIVDKECILEFMKVNELRKLSKQSNTKPISLERKDVTLSLLDIPITQLRNEAVSSIKKRYLLTTCLFVQSIGDEGVKPSSIKYLSVNKDKQKNVKSNTSNISNIIDLFDLN
ncbi:hypothetical protein PCNPT3_00440 [Psychromonas sp. CNPT3]|uniref:sce7726 family protein n=1 Tax=Psychromonas sp. CNPT3 TaxID=314282 RepID=UPI00006E8957|nr:sce7726 family protein [Psychromonas sp. CNPT3]AGH80030.1 hypothetical protein PCNPT3_00440 [Psychromonas sp. CNPT3]